MMLTQFPIPYPDELLYSICARYTAHMRFASANIAVEELFGTRNIVAVVDLPSRLDTLANRLPKSLGLNSELLISNHTSLPLFAPFLPGDALHRVRGSMFGNKGGTVHSRIGIMASGVKSLRKLRFCPMCVNEDRSKYGECYWHRVHNIAGINVCAHHGCILQDSILSFQRQSTYYAYNAAEDYIPEIEFADPTPANLHLYALAKQAYWLLNNTSNADLNDMYTVYRRCLDLRGFTTASNSIRQQQLQSTFIDFYTPELLDTISCSLEDVHQTWLSRLVGGDYVAHHPLRHLLVLHFFGHTPESALKSLDEPTPDPFGHGPWPCLNRVCPHSHKDVIETCNVRRSRYTRDRPIGTFACPFCGFSYIRTGPDQSQNSRYHISKIQAFGFIWEKRLVELFAQQILSLRAISKILGVDPKTVKRHAQRLIYTGNKTLNKDLSNTNASRDATDLLISHRHTWLKAIKVFPQFGVSQLRKRFSASYAWLYRNDKAWLVLHTPARSSRIIRTNRVSWPARDKLLAQAVQEAATRILSQEQWPNQMTLGAIGREAACLPILQQHLDKLPQTADRLKSLVETREEWAVRRLQWTINQAQNQGLILKGWEIVQRSGLGRFPKKWFEHHGIPF
ncbi:TnsD family Tn7-like transposition protein [Herpetosiphon giganteus]|uniref:TnsD family Tn7-like transposition protein n=1 Tax=Herpetosiphon giganteus TaxID=2029754 RepID=UPI00195E9252|nr:TnsD family Tn7-like transposition protein [Herpetosiphon giganteus]MBM7841609.1 transposase-like protein [Herpetosiphon giganteus]